MNTPIIFLGIPSVIALGLILFFLWKNCERKIVIAFIIAASAYGVLRANALRLVLNEGILFPYLMNFEVARFGAVSLQEVIGWSLAASLSWIIADRLLWRFQIRPFPHRVAFLAAVCLTTICLAVETAAIEAGWWTWTIRQINRPLIGFVPLVGLLDWGFVAFDFLLAYLLLIRPAPLSARIIALIFFPLHFLGHSKMILLPEPLWLDLNDLLHGAIAGYVLIRAIDEKGETALPHPGKARFRFVPLIAAAIIVCSTIGAALFAAKTNVNWFAPAPLTLLALIAFVKPFPVPSETSVKKQETRSAKGKPDKKEKKVVKTKKAAEPLSNKMFFTKIAVAVAVFVAVYLIRAPFHKRTENFKAALQSGISQINQNNLDGAIVEFRKAISYRPDNASGHSLLGQFLLIQKNYSEAREELKAALALKPTDMHSLIQISALEIIEEQWDEAQQYASYGMSLYPDRPDFIYLFEKAKSKNVNTNLQTAFDAAQRAGVTGLNTLATAARLLGDTETINTCRKLIKDRSAR